MEIIQEGKVKIIKYKNVFYNPDAKLSRDIGIAFITSITKILNRELKICEALAATGVRGIRYIIEGNCVKKIVLNDRSEIAYKNIVENIKMNKVKNIAEAECKDANLLFNEKAKKGKRFDFVDIDPYGSPIQFIQSAIRSIAHKGYLAITATDTAALCGVSLKACLRKYSSFSYRTEFMNELGLRILIGSAIRIAATNEIALEPVLSHSTRHYMRAYFKVYISSSKTDHILKEIGYAFYCEKCLWRNYEKGFIYFKNYYCPECKNKLIITGPLWLGKILEKETLKKSLKIEIKEAKNLLELLLNEVDSSVFYYQIDKICKVLKVSEPKIESIINELKKLGFIAKRTHFSNKGIKTNADIKTLKKIILELRKI